MTILDNLSMESSPMILTSAAASSATSGTGKIVAANEKVGRILIALILVVVFVWVHEQEVALFPSAILGSGEVVLTRG